MRRVAISALGLALAVFAIGFALLPLQTRAATQELSRRHSLASEAGLTRAQTLSLAEQVRAFVVERRGTLPAVVDGRAGFDAAAVSHLADVARVLSATRVVTLVLGVLLVALGSLGLARGHAAFVSVALKSGAVCSVALPLLIGSGAVIDFDRFFTALHAMLFTGDSWLFPSDSLLIQLFPEPFWVAEGVAWGVGIVVLGAVFGTVGVVLGRLSARPSPNVKDI